MFELQFLAVDFGVVDFGVVDFGVVELLAVFEDDGVVVDD
jgi:hypothetical protein